MSEARAFADMEARVITLLGSGDIDGALGVVREATDRFPGRIAYTAFWEACIRGVEGRGELGVRALAAPLDTSDVWWSPELLLSDPDLDRVRDEAGFEKVLAECDRRARAARSGAAVAWEVVGDKDAAAGLVVMHGRTGNLADLVDRWGPAAPASVTTVVVQSSQMVASGMHCWDDLEVAAADVATVVRSALDPAQEAVLAGFSQGGGTAARLALGGEVHTRGFVAVAPSFSREGLEPGDIGRLLPDAANAGVRGWLAIGETDDRYRAPAERVGAALESAGVAVEWTVVPGLGHDYPSPFDEHLARAVSFVLEATSSISS